MARRPVTDLHFGFRFACGFRHLVLLFRGTLGLRVAGGWRALGEYFASRYFATRVARRWGRAAGHGAGYGLGGGVSIGSWGQGASTVIDVMGFNYIS